MWMWLLEFLGNKTLLGSAGGVFVALYAVLAPKDTGKATRIRLHQLLIEPGWLAKYRDLLSLLQRLFLRVYGEARSLRSLNLSLLIAIFYPLLFFAWSYAQGGPHQIAGINALPDEPNRWVRWIWFVGSAAFLGMMGALTIYQKRVDAWAKHKVANSVRPQWMRLALAFSSTLPLWVVVAVMLSRGRVVYAIAGAGAGAIALAREGFLASALAGVVSVSAAGVFAGAGASALAGALAGVGAVAGAVTGAVASAVASAIAGPLAFALAFAFGSAFAFTFAGVLAGASVDGFLWLMFIVVFPSVNGLNDWVSLRVSRYFIDQAQKPLHWCYPALDVVIDGLAGILFLLGLTLALPSAIETINLALPLLPDAEVDEVLHWRVLAEQARSDPWAKGSMVTMMLVTTLVPTGLHIACGSLALALQWIPGQRFADFLMRMNDDERPEYGNLLDPALLALLLMGYVVLALLPMLIVALLAQWFWALPIAEGLYWAAVRGAHPAWLLLLPLLYVFGRCRFVNA